MSISVPTTVGLTMIQMDPDVAHARYSSWSCRLDYSASSHDTSMSLIEESLIEEQGLIVLTCKIGESG